MSDVATSELNRLAFERRVRRLWRLGPRPIGELLIELAAISSRTTWLDHRLDDYAVLSPETLDAVGGVNWQKPVLHLVAGGRR